MPTYAYACTECGHTFDAVQSFTDDALTTCPECSGTLRKQYGAVGVVFKGGGFYRNDSRVSTTKGDPGSTPSASDSPSTDSSSSSSDSSSSDSSSTSSAATDGSSTSS